MSKLKVYNIEGADAGEVTIANTMLITDKGEQAVRDCITAFMAGRRGGNASTLTKGEVAGSNKKPWRQKGTGRARAGYRQSPVWRGGSVVFGPRPRSYSKKLNRKVAKLGFQRAFSDVLAEGKLKVVDALKLDDVKTKQFAAIMKALEVTSPALVVVNELTRNIALATRNIKGVELVLANDVNVYQLVRYPNIIITKSAVTAIKDRIAGKVKAGKTEEKEAEAKV